VTADPRLTAAREYIGHARGLQIGQVPHPALQRIAAELRRQLGQVLNVVDEASATMGQADEAAWRRVVRTPLDT
jgi:Flp pilus assembly protein TadB